ncbi:unnamed protein product [Amoebophrya sp. A25]|nr:unnamed protein product [Amoebophrya sp. A25]|eukprot:GSA25T00020498001.1
MDPLGCHFFEDDMRENTLEEENLVFPFIIQQECGTKIQPLDTQGIFSSLKRAQGDVDPEEYYSLTSPLYRDYVLAKLRQYSHNGTFDRCGFVLRSDAFAPLQSELRKFLLDKQ